MLNRIRLENFKSIKFLDFQCAKLNLLAGLNGSGKSSFVQFLNFLRCYAKKDLKPRLWCPYRDLGLPGGFKDVKYCYAREDEQVRFHVDFAAKENFVWTEGEEQCGSIDRIIYLDDYEKDNVCVEDSDVYERSLSLVKNGELAEADEHNKGLAYAPACDEDIKFKQKEFWDYVKSVEGREKLIQSAYKSVWENARFVDAFRRKPVDVHVGSGEYGSMKDATRFDVSFDPEGVDAVEYLYKFGRIVRLDQANPMIYPGSELHEVVVNSVEEDLLFNKNPGAYFMDDPLKYEYEDGDIRRFSTLLEQVDAWLSVVSPGAHLNISRESAGDKEWFVAMVGFGEEGCEKMFRPQNVGFGISYVLPVLATVLTARPTDIIIIENPEAHLHPKGQSEMGKLLARAAAYGVQIFVETHSDHVINGIRVSTKQGILHPSDVNIAFFDRRKHKVRYADGIREEYYADIFNIKVDKNGALSNYPKGFLDEWNNQYYRLNR